MPRVNTSERFWSLVEKTGPEHCWIFKGRKRGGYGQIGFQGKPSTGAHRVAWILENGSIPDGICVLHRCDNPPCVNPQHLFLGSSLENNLDRHAKGRSKNLFTSSKEHPAKLRSGEQHWSAKLSASQVLEIRSLHAAGVKQSKLGTKFSVNAATISRIVRGVWRTEVL